MKKICCLIPCLMLPNNRDVNHKAMKRNHSELGLDEYFVCDQKFDKSDYVDGFTYIAYSEEPMGWAKSRNRLLESFYNSDYDYAFWIDANSTISKSTLNDLLTIFDAIRTERITDIDAIFSTLGIIVSQERINCKKLPDNLDNVTLLPAKFDKTQLWMHGLIIKNFQKYYNQPLYIDERCDARQGNPEDIYFSRLLRTLTNTYLAPTVIINKPPAKTSTWMQDKGSYDYPTVYYDTVDTCMRESISKNTWKPVNVKHFRDIYKLPRLEQYKELVKPYVPRKKKLDDISNSKVSLF